MQSIEIVVVIKDFRWMKHNDIAFLWGFTLISCGFSGKTNAFIFRQNLSPASSPSKRGVKRERSLMGHDWWESVLFSSPCVCCVPFFILTTLLWGCGDVVIHWELEMQSHHLCVCVCERESIYSDRLWASMNQLLPGSLKSYLCSSLWAQIDRAGIQARRPWTST